jgi:hypothetical protein
MSYFVNRLGKRYGRLLVIEQLTQHAPIKWKCQCDCGKIVTRHGSGIVKSATASCGCWRGEKIASAKTKHGQSLNPTTTYRAWTHLRQRCNNPNNHDYKHYGGRGIRVCERWLESFNNFLVDMGECPPGKSIERKDVNGHYEPGNCCWASQREQVNNLRRTHRIDWNGVTKTISQWAEALGQSRNLINGRLKKKWPVERALTEPVNWYRKPWRANRVSYA